MDNIHGAREARFGVCCHAHQPMTQAGGTVLGIYTKRASNPCHMTSLSVKKRRNGRPVDTNGNYRRKPSKAQAQVSNVSPPTQANNTAKQQPAEHAYTSLNRQPTYQATARTSDQDLSHTARHSTTQKLKYNRQA